MKHTFLAAAAVIAMLGLSSETQAQIVATPGMGVGSVGADPFSGYYSWFLPRQAAMASQPTVNRQLNMYMADRVSDQLSPPSSNLGSMDFSNFGIGGANSPDLNTDAPRNPRPRLSSTGPVVENGMGRGLTRFHGRAASYYPTMRNGTSANPGLPKSRRGR